MIYRNAGQDDIRNFIFNSKRKDLCYNCWETVVNQDPVMIIFSPHRMRQKLHDSMLNKNVYKFFNES